ncbi:hypothetical protein JHW43_007624 [Diplocarpon mali]|nr:hypothetical protein JHW43_007624 [Diplocarpon mali]
MAPPDGGYEVQDRTSVQAPQPPGTPLPAARLTGLGPPLQSMSPSREAPHAKMQNADRTPGPARRDHPRPGYCVGWSGSLCYECHKKDLEAVQGRGKSSALDARAGSRLESVLDPSNPSTPEVSLALPAWSKEVRRRTGAGPSGSMGPVPVVTTQINKESQAKRGEARRSEARRRTLRKGGRRVGGGVWAGLGWANPVASGR